MPEWSPKHLTRVESRDNCIFQEITKIILWCQLICVYNCFIHYLINMFTITFVVGIKDKYVNLFLIRKKK